MTMRTGSVGVGYVLVVVLGLLVEQLAGADEKPSAQGSAGELTAVQIALPKPKFIGTPSEAKVAGPLEPPRKEPRAPLLAPAGVQNLALKCPVTASDMEPMQGKLELITDGDKEADGGNVVELGPQLQWVQIDLGKPCEIWGILVWHQHADPRVYKDVIVEASDDADFITEVKPIFNNDHDNTAGKGLGKDRMYFETNEGKLIETKGQVKVRYVRLYSNGSTAGEMNHYLEVEVYGIPAK